MGSIDEFIFDIDDGHTRSLVSELHVLIMAQHPAIKSSIKYKIPFYQRYKLICYINPLKKGGVELAFINGQQLSDPHKILQFKNRKQIAGIEIQSIEEIIKEEVCEMIHIAMLKDEENYNLK